MEEKLKNNLFQTRFARIFILVNVNLMTPNSSKLNKDCCKNRYILTYVTLCLWPSCSHDIDFSYLKKILSLLLTCKMNICRKLWASHSANEPVLRAESELRSVRGHAAATGGVLHYGPQRTEARSSGLWGRAGSCRAQADRDRACPVLSLCPTLTR